MTARVLVTGGAGFIGAHTCIALLKKGYDVRALDALVAPVHTTPERPRYLHPEVELQIGDVRDRDALAKAMQDVEYVIHLAAEQGYGPHFSTFFSVNTVSTALLYELAVAERIPLRKVVVASSQAVYGEGLYRCRTDGYVRPSMRSNEQLERGEWEVACPICGDGLLSCETDESEISASNSYAVSKHTQEEVALMLGLRYDIPATCYRYSIVQGPFQSFSNAYSGICRTFVLRVLAGKSPVAYEDGEQARDYIWVGDVANANVLALTDSRTDNDVFNVGGAQTMSVTSYGTLVARILERPDLYTETPGLYRFGDTRHITSTSKKLRSLGWKQTLSVTDIIQRYADWAREQPDVHDHFDGALEKMLRAGTVRSIKA